MTITDGPGEQSLTDLALLRPLIEATLPSLVLAESETGGAGPLVGALPPDWSVARAAGAQITRAQVGGIAAELHLDETVPRAIVLEDAQWADPTSLGRIQRLLHESPGPLLVIVAHRPVDGVDRWWLDQLADAARSRGAIEELSLPPAETQSLPPLPEDVAERDLVIAAGLMCESISVPVAARLVELPEADTLALAERLVEAGWLRQTRAGFHPARSGVLNVVGEARIGYVAGRLATVLEDTGGNHSVIGSLRLAAGDSAAAFGHLEAAAIDAERHRAGGEAFHLAEAALVAAVDGDVGDRAELGNLHLIAARFLRSAGRSEAAARHLDSAVGMLDGPERIDALGFSASVADDLHRPQDSETILAVAEWEAASQGEIGKLASIMSLRARSLHRIGFTQEADAIAERAAGLIEEHGVPQQRYYSAVNHAWISFDRGQVARAEAEFAQLVPQAAEMEGDASVADKEAWRARALFASGRPAEGLAAVAVVEELAESAGVEAPLFLANLALAEGGLLFGRFDQAIAASDRVGDLVERQLPGWKNIAHHNRAAALLGLGRVAEAAAEVEQALAATPKGANGWRWRLRSRALELEIETAAGNPWPKQEAVDLTDLMLQSHLFGWASELMVANAENSKDREVAVEAMELALLNGNPMVAARAASAGRLWRDPRAAPVVHALHTMESAMPKDWVDNWRQLDSVKEGLAIPEPDGEALVPDTSTLDAALRRAGLAGTDVILSPAQRRSKGLTRRRRVYRPVQIAAAAIAVVALAGGTSYAIAQMRPDPTPSTVIVQVTTPTEVTVPTLENTQIDVPASIDRLVGTVEHRGGPARTGVFDAAGPQSVNGYYWRYPAAGPIDASPIAYGNNVIFGGTDGTLYAIDQTSGDVAWQMLTQDRISTAPALGDASLGEGSMATMVIVASDDGRVRAREAVNADVQERWSTPVGTRIRSTPVVAESVVMVATTDGFVHGLDLASGSTLWQYPAPGEDGLGPISADLTYSEGILYVGTEQSGLHLLNAVDGTFVCENNVGAAPIVTAPIVSDGAVYVATRAQTIFILPTGACSGSVPDRPILYPTDSGVQVGFSIAGDVLYLPSGKFLYAINLLDNTDIWSPATIFMDEAISTPPVVAGDTVYFGTEGGLVVAVDSTTGAEKWRWQTGNYVRGAPAVVDGAVFIVSGDGTITAVGE